MSDPVTQGESRNARILFLGKRHYTNKDAWTERFGRIYRLPERWACQGRRVRLCLVDYRGGRAVSAEEGRLQLRSAAVTSPRFLALVAGALRFRPAIVVASGDCYIGLLGWCLARLSGARFVFDIYDKYDEFGGYVRPLGWDLFGFLRRHAEMRLYASRSLAELYRRPGDDPARDLAVPNGVDLERFRPLPMAECRARLGLDGRQTLVGYFGSMEADRGVTDLIAAVGLLRERGYDLRLLIGGRAHPDTALDAPWVDYRGIIPHADMPCAMAAMDLLALPYRLTPFMDHGASCKIAEYLACRRPIVSTRTPNFLANFPGQARVLESLLCEPGDVTALATAIVAQLERRVLAPVAEDLSWPQIADRTLSAIEAGSDLQVR